MTAVGWVGAVFAVFGGGFAAVGVGLGLHQRRLERENTRVPGTIVDIAETSRVNDKTRLHAAVFEFVAADGTRVRKTSSVASGTPSHAVGDQVMVWFDPGDPRRADIVGEASGLAPGIIAAGVVVLVIGLGLVVFGRTP